MEVWFKCPHCGNTGDDAPHHVMDKMGEIQPIEGVEVSAQWFECGRCKIESPSFVYVRRGAVTSHLVDEHGALIAPGLMAITTEIFWDLRSYVANAPRVRLLATITPTRRP